MSFPMSQALSEIQTVSFKILSLVADSIVYDNNRYPKRASLKLKAVNSVLSYRLNLFDIMFKIILNYTNTLL